MSNLSFWNILYISLCELISRSIKVWLSIGYIDFRLIFKDFLKWTHLTLRSPYYRLYSLIRCYVIAEVSAALNTSYSPLLQHVQQPQLMRSAQNDLCHLLLHWSPTDEMDLPQALHCILCYTLRDNVYYFHFLHKVNKNLFTDFK